MPDPGNATAPGGNRGGAKNLLGGGYTTDDTDSALFAAAVGRALLAEPNQLADVMGTIVPEDLPEPYAYAWSLLAQIRDVGVGSAGTIAEAFAERATQPEPGLVPRFQPAPRTWAAKAMSAVVDFGPGLSFAMRGLIGRGAIRAAEDAARRIQRACALGDTSDLAEIREIIEQELPKLAAAVGDAQEGTTRDRMTRGGSFVLDAPDHVPARWGADDCVLWAEGEALILVGPPGVGKTTLGGQITAGLLGIGSTVLGMPVRPARRVLYLAMDRPRQIARSLRRTLGRADRKHLDDNLIVWEGPPPADVARHPEVLLRLARQANADVVIIDSLKDAALGLTEDEVGAGYNRARQLCLANGIDVLELHHLVKRGPNGAKPTTLADVYGSAWITAGAGSVVLLWGAAGDPIVELVHLKQPSEPFGPCKVIHDHTAGTSVVCEGTDLEAVARAAGTKGITAKDAASVLFSTEKPTASEVEKARRKLDKILSLARIDGSRETNTPAVWTNTDPSRSGLEREGITDPLRPSRGEELLQVSDHHGPSRDLHADPPSRTPTPLYGGGVKGVMPLCASDGCVNVAEASGRCWKCGTAA